MRYFLILLFGLSLAAIPGKSWAALSVVSTQSMSFGSFVIRSFASIARLTVHQATGVVTGDANVVLLSGGQNAQFSLTGGPLNTAFTVTLDATVSPMRIGSSFVLDQFSVAPAVLQTNGAGDDTFSIGFRATSAGGGLVYTDGVYNGNYDFTVQF